MGLPGGPPPLTFVVPEEQNTIPALLELANKLQTTLPAVFSWVRLTDLILRR